MSYISLQHVAIRSSSVYPPLYSDNELIYPRATNKQDISLQYGEEGPSYGSANLESVVGDGA